jgi:hypothetical protein
VTLSCSTQNPVHSTESAGTSAAVVVVGGGAAAAVGHLDLDLDLDLDLTQDPVNSAQR